MATPKSFKSAAISLVKSSLSPRNPKFLDKPSPKFLGPPHNNSRSPVSRKSLNFSQVKNGQKRRILNAFDARNPSLFFEEDVSPKQKKGSILINTPTKSDLLKNGLSDKGRLLDILGRGSFGTVVKGFYKNRMVAVKITRGNEKEKEPSDANARGLSHENVVQILDIVTGPNSEHSIIIMEYLEGGQNLQSVLELTPNLSERSKKRIIEQICLGLQYCHQKGVLHLDVKPKNIMVLPNLQCKLCDFGNSCRIENRENYVYQGTVPYAAPELLRGMVPTVKSDIYSLGITIWQIEYKKNPYECWSSSKCLVYHVVKNKVRPDYEMNDDLITKVFLSCWNDNPSARLNLEEILEML